jgi:hypothetical protein
MEYKLNPYSKDTVSSISSTMYINTHLVTLKMDEKYSNYL